MMEPLPVEIVMLGMAFILLLTQLFLQSLSATMEMGGDYKVGPRDEHRQVQGVFAGRAERAYRNLLESFPPFAALALALVATERSGGLGAWGAEAWVVLRILYLPLYLFHVPWARSLVWFASIFALVAMLIRLFE